MNAHELHPDCPDEPHTHALDRPFMFITGHWSMFDRQLIVTFSKTLGDRIAALLDRHGLIDIPDTIPLDHMWAPPHTADAIIDPRLPADPTKARR